MDASTVVRIVTGAGSNHLQQLSEQWSSDGEQFIAPDLLGYEFASSMYKLVRGGADPESISPAFETLRQMKIDLVDCSGFHEDALALTIKYRLRATYDAHYLLLAAKRGVDLYTCDRRLFNSLRGEWPLVHIVD